MKEDMSKCNSFDGPLCSVCLSKLACSKIRTNARRIRIVLNCPVCDCKRLVVDCAGRMVTFEGIDLDG